MKLTFLGATHEVTGSCYYLEADGKRILVDCGMEQGRDMFENQAIPVKAGDIDMVLLTHAHIDHSGLLPLLSKEGFQGQIFSTEGTRELCSIMLMDSAHIQESEAEWKNRKAIRAGKPEVAPMYDIQDAQNAMKCFVGIPYGKETQISDGIRVRFIDAGHLLGSASIEIWIREGDIEKKLVFSGDIGNSDQPLINDPTYLTEADYVVMESTYGNRSHEKPEIGGVRTNYATELAMVLQETFDRGGNVVIPSFAVGRTQEMLYFIRQIKQDNLVKGHDGFEVWVDSPLAVEATGVFMNRMYEDFDEEARALLNQGINPISFAGLRTSVTSEESRAINDNPASKGILSASGMCDAGRIKHHLKHNLWRPESTILFVGYQSEGTLGRSLVDGAEKVKLFSEEIDVKAKILVLPGVSGHADDEGLMRWISAFTKKPDMVFVTHGEDSVCTFFAERVNRELGLKTYAPWSGTIFDLASGEFFYEAEPVPIQKKVSTEDLLDDLKTASDSLKEIEKEALAQPDIMVRGEDAREGGRSPKAKDRKAAGIYAALVQAGRRLINVIRENEGGANKDLQKFTSELNNLCDRWER